MLFSEVIRVKRTQRDYSLSFKLFIKNLLKYDSKIIAKKQAISSNINNDIQVICKCLILSI